MSTTTELMTADELFENHPPHRCELVRGELRLMSPAGSQHGWVIMNIAAPLAHFVREHDLGYVFGAETGFVIERDPDTVRAPDVAFVRKSRTEGSITEEFFAGPPDLVVEVLSPSDTASAVQDKAENWLRCGCLEVWLVDPQRKTMSSLKLIDGNTVLSTSVDELVSELLPGFRISTAEVFPA